MQSMHRFAIAVVATICVAMLAGCATMPAASPDTARRHADVGTVVALELVELERGQDEAATVADVVDSTAYQIVEATEDGSLDAADIVAMATGLASDRLSGPWTAVGRLVAEMIAGTARTTEAMPEDQRLIWLREVALGLTDGVAYFRAFSVPGTRSAPEFRSWRWAD